MKNWKIISLVLMSLIMGYIVEFFVYKPNTGTFLSSDMDPLGNVYVLGVDERNDKYKISKISNNGRVVYQKNLDKSTESTGVTYRDLEVDSKGNIYLIKEERDLQAIVGKEDFYPIKKESVLMFDSKGAYVKEVASKDFKDDANPPSVSYIRKLQVVDQMITIVTCQKYSYSVATINPLVDESPKTIESFTIEPSTEQHDETTQWVNDIAVLSNDRVVYTTKNGEFFAMDNQGKFLNYTNLVSSDAVSLVGLSVDSADNLYFSDALSGKFYKVNTKSLVPTVVYNFDNVINESGITVEDVRSIKVLSDGDYYAVSKNFENPYHVRFGSNSMLISNIRSSFFPWGFLIMLAVAGVVGAAAIGIYILFKRGIKRIPLAVRITSMFFPIYIISMGMLVYIITGDAVSDYTSVLLNDQDIGAKVVVDHIDGDKFQEINHVSDYMTSSYNSLKNDIRKGYSDLASKVGDRSDYIITYTAKSGKLYSTINSKYADTSTSYNELKYTDPDMVVNGAVAIEYVLEKEESAKLYEVWNEFSSNKNTGAVRATFNDVHGNIDASFVAIRNSNGDAVGFVGNFMDEQIHRTQAIWSILGHSMAVIIIVTFLVIAYMCFVIIVCLRPLKKIENGINRINKGDWETRIVVPSKDELADIAASFNLLAEKMAMYTSNLVRLNEEYIKFVPKEMFKLIDKSKITDVKLRDNKTMDMNMLYFVFNLSCKGAYDFKNEKELFDLMSDSYESIFKVVEDNNGIIQYFDGINAMILFPESAQDAFNASLQFKEVFIDEKVRDNMNIILGTGEVLVGISGNDKRRGVMVVSEELLQMFNIDSHIDSKLKNMHVNHVATKQVIEKLNGKSEGNFRFIGKISNVSGDGSVELYEIIDSSNSYKKDLYVKTKDMFEKAVNLYVLADFEEARKLFASIARINEKDYVTLQYLDMCDKQINRKENDEYDKRKWTGNLFD